MKYAIKRIKDGKFVAVHNRENTYTSGNSNYIRFYKTLDEARKDCCSNEIIVVIKGD
jgi:hypothetical protein